VTLRILALLAAAGAIACLVHRIATAHQRRTPLREQAAEWWIARRQPTVAEYLAQQAAQRADTVEMPPVQAGPQIRPAAPDLPPQAANRVFDEIVARNPDLASIDVLALTDLYIIPPGEQS
jgi:hypothetical protein